LKTVLLFAMSSLLLLAGCATPDTRAERARFACYDARGRFAATITTQAECELRLWTWHQVTE